MVTVLSMVAVSVVVRCGDSDDDKDDDKPEPAEVRWLTIAPSAHADEPVDK